MRDSPLKRVLVRAYFSALEVSHGFRGAVAGPDYYAALESDYDLYWRRRAGGSFQPRFGIIADGIESGASVLDVGCGDGAMLDFLTKTKAVKGFGIDISAEAVRRAHDKGINASLQTVSELSKAFGGAQYDHVVMSEVIEHVANPESLIREGWAVCKESLWVTFPNIAYFPHRLRLLFARFPVQWTVFPGEHLRFWSVTDFLFWIRDLDLPGPLLRPSNGLTFLALHRLWPNLFANQIVVRVKKEAVAIVEKSEA